MLVRDRCIFLLKNCEMIDCSDFDYFTSPLSISFSEFNAGMYMIMKIWILIEEVRATRGIIFYDFFVFSSNFFFFFLGFLLIGGMSF